MSCRTMVLMRYAMSENETKHTQKEETPTFFQRLKSVYTKFKESKLF